MNLKKYVNYSLSSLSFCAIFASEVEAVYTEKERNDTIRMPKVEPTDYSIIRRNRALEVYIENCFIAAFEELDYRVLMNDKEAVRNILAHILVGQHIPSSLFGTYNGIMQNRDSEILDLLLNHCSPEDFADEQYSYDSLCPFVESGDIESIQKLTQKGANLNVRDGSELDDPLLFRAVTPAMISFFQENGADMNAKNSLGHTVLFMTPFWGSYEPTLNFLENGVDPTIQDKKGNTFLHYNKDPNLMYSIAKNIPREVLSQLLLIRNEEGNTLLHCAILNQAESLVKYLLSLYSFMNIDIDVVNIKNQTPFALAQGTSMERFFEKPTEE